MVVYQRAYATALVVHRKTLGFPQIEQFALADQARRASKSVCANIVEGFARHHHSAAEFKRFLAIALGSSDEMLLWSQFSYDLGYISHDEWQSWSTEYGEISRMIFGLIRNWKSTKN